MRWRKTPWPKSSQRQERATCCRASICKIFHPSTARTFFNAATAAFEACWTMQITLPDSSESGTSHGDDKDLSPASRR